MRNKGFTIIEMLVGLAITSIVIVGLMDLFGKFSIGNLQFCNSTQDVLSINRTFDLFERDMDIFARTRGQVRSKRFSYDVYDTEGNSWITYEIHENTVRRTAKEPGSRPGTNILLTFRDNAAFYCEDNILTFEIDGFTRSTRLE